MKTQSYSESTIKQQGSYSLKRVNVIADVKIFRYYFFGLFKREIKIPYTITNGGLIFLYPPKKKDKVIITYCPSPKCTACFIKRG